MSDKTDTLNEIIISAFHDIINVLKVEVKVMPLSRWNESILRYFFCRYIAMSYSDVEQYIECDRIDLVLRYESQIAFIEFKFYRHPRRYDPYSGSMLGYKGGAGRQNLKEFQTCINQLNNRRSEPNLSKYIVLVYIDPIEDKRPLLRFSNQYSKYQYPNKNVKLCLIGSGKQIIIKNDIIQTQLYNIRTT